jgi:hypothetical protein
MSRRKRVAAVTLLAAGALALGAAGCGDDEEQTISISVPEVTTTPSVPETTTSTTAPTETTGGTGTKTVDPGQADSEANDVPPPPGSPQAKFEKACKQNPALCAD